MYLPYKEVSSETYEQFDLQGMGLMTKRQSQALFTALWDTHIQLFGLLSDIQAFGLAQGDSTGEDSHE